MSDLPPRVDLRDTLCFPYPETSNQGADQSCVAHSFALALYCLKAGTGQAHFPRSRQVYPSIDRLYSVALKTSPNKVRGVSFAGVIGQLLSEHVDDLADLRWQLAKLANSPDEVKAHLSRGAPVIAGYQVNATIAAFHKDPELCSKHGFLLPSFRKDPHSVSAHAIVLIGYDNCVGCFLARNSWGSEWGVDGHFLVRYEDLADPLFFTDLVSFSPF